MGQNNQRISYNRILAILICMEEDGYLESHKGDTFDGEAFEVVFSCLQECLTERRNNNENLYEL